MAVSTLSDENNSSQALPMSSAQTSPKQAFFNAAAATQPQPQPQSIDINAQPRFTAPVQTPQGMVTQPHQQAPIYVPVGEQQIRPNEMHAVISEGAVNDLQSNLKKASVMSQQSYQQNPTLIGAAETTAIGTGYLAFRGLKGVVEGGYNLIFHPIKSTESTIGMVVNPGGFVQTLAEQASTDDPLGFVAETAGQLWATKKVMGAVFENIPVLRTTEFPQEAGETVTVRQLAIERPNGKSFILGSLKTSPVIEATMADNVVTPKAFDFSVDVFKGAPDVMREIRNLKMDTSTTPTGGAGEGIRISYPAETKMIQKNLLGIDPALFENVPRGKEFIPAAQGIIKGVGEAQSPFIRDLPTNTKYLDIESTKIILQGAKESESYVSGSFSRGGQLAEDYTYGGKPMKLDKIPGDIDVHTLGTANDVFLREMTDLRRLQEAGKQVRISGLDVIKTPQGDVFKPGVIPNAIEVFDPETKAFVKGVEYLNKDVVPESSITPDMVVGFAKEGPKIKIGDTSATSLAEETRGTIQGVARLRRGPNGLIDIFPREGRLKDVASVSVSARSLFEGVNYKNPIRGNTLMNNILKFESFYPEDVVKGQVADIGIADFRKSSTAKGSAFSGFKDAAFFSGFGSAAAKSTASMFFGSGKGKGSPSNIPSGFPSGLNIKSPFGKSPSSSSPYSNLLDISPSPSPSPRSRSPYSSLIISPYSPSPKSPSPSPSPSPYSPSPYSPSPYSPSPYSPKSPSPFSFSLFNEPKKKGGKPIGLFDVFVRESRPKGKGKIKEYLVGKQLPEISALNLGSYYADITTSRTFRLVPHGAGDAIDQALNPRISKFRGPKGRSKLHPMSYVEKSANAIDTASEKRGLKIGALLAKKRKGGWF